MTMGFKENNSEAFTHCTTFLNEQMLISVSILYPGSSWSPWTTMSASQELVRNANSWVPLRTDLLKTTLSSPASESNPHLSVQACTQVFILYWKQTENTRQKEAMCCALCHPFPYLCVVIKPCSKIESVSASREDQSPLITSMSNEDTLQAVWYETSVHNIV